MSRDLWRTLGVIAIVAGLAFVVLHQWEQLVGHDDGRFVEEANAALALHDSYAKTLGRLKAAQRVHTVVMVQWRTIADTASTDSARVDAWKAAANECQVALLACSERALLAEARVRELEPLLVRGVAIADCHVLGLGFMPKCLSRAQSFVLGAALGMGAMVVLRR